MRTIASQRKIMVSADGPGLISRAGGLLLLETLRVTGLGRELSAQLERWRPARAIHGPGKVVADLALTLALGGDCLADIAILRAQPELFGPVASDPTVSRLIDRLAADPIRALKGIRAARATAREHAGKPAGTHAPSAGGELIGIDIERPSSSGFVRVSWVPANKISVHHQHHVTAPAFSARRGGRLPVLGEAVRQPADVLTEQVGEQPHARVAGVAKGLRRSAAGEPRPTHPGPASPADRRPWPQRPTPPSRSSPGSANGSFDRAGTLPIGREGDHAQGK